MVGGLFVLGWIERKAFNHIGHEGSQREKTGLAEFDPGEDGTLECKLNYSFAPLGLVCLRFCPTACAVGCILAPHRG